MASGAKNSIEAVPNFALLPSKSQAAEATQRRQASQPIAAMSIARNGSHNRKAARLSAIPAAAGVIGPGSSGCTVVFLVVETGAADRTPKQFFSQEHDDDSQQPEYWQHRIAMVFGVSCF